MPEPLLPASKKCHACQQWSAWRLSPDDRCENCGELLDPQAQRYAQQREEMANQKPSPGMQLIEIRPEDSGFIWFVKIIVRGGQMAFAAILAFIIWLVTLAAG